MNVPLRFQQNDLSYKQRNMNWTKLVFYSVFLIVAYIALTPILMLLYSSFSSAEGKLPFEGMDYSISNYFEILNDSVTYMLLYNTILFTAGSMAIGVGLAIVMAWILERTNLPLKTVVYGIIMVPMAIPNMIYAISWTQLLENKIGMVNLVFQNLFGLESGPFNIYSLGGMIFVQGIHMVPTALLMIAATFATLDPSLEEQSAICGRGLFTTVRRVTLPVLKPALLSCALFFAIVVIETFEVPATLGFSARTPVLSTQIYFATHPLAGQLPDYGMASALGVMLLLLVLILIWFYQRSTKNAEKFTTITGKGYRPKVIDLGRWKWTVVILVWFLLFVTVFLPFMTLLWTSFHPFYIPFSWEALTKSSLAAYKNVIQVVDLGSVVWNTVFMTMASGIISVVLVTLVGWFVVRGPFSRTKRRALDTISFMPQAVPAVVIGLSLMFLYIYIPLPIYGSIWILIIGIVTKYLAFGSRTMIAAQMQISNELEEASAVSGAGWLRTMRKVMLPLLTPAILNCFIWIAVHAMRELSVVIMVYSPKTVVLSTTIWNLWESGTTSEAAVLGVLLIVFLSVLFIGGQVLVRKIAQSR